MINVFQPALGQQELDALAPVFASNWIGKGDPVLRFERGFAAGLGADASRFLSTTCATEGLFLAAELLGWRAGDEVVAPSVSFVAVGSAVIASGARLVLCDVDERTLNITMEALDAVISPRTRAVVINHYGGRPCEMESLIDYCRARGIAVVEDSACAVRSFRQGRGCGTLGDIGVWSFDSMKTLCTGDGGMLCFADLELRAVAAEQLYLGLPQRQKSGMDSVAGGASNWWEYQVVRPGRRAVMNNIAGAIGEVQLSRLPGFLARREAIHQRYVAELADLTWLSLPPALPAGDVSSYYLFWVQLERRDALARFLYERGIYTTFRYWPLHRVDYFSAGQRALPVSDRVASRTLNLPLHQSLSDDDVSQIIEAVRAFEGSATR